MNFVSLHSVRFVSQSVFIKPICNENLMHLMHIEISAVASIDRQLVSGVLSDLQVPVSPGLPTLAQQSVKPSLATSEDTAVLGGSQLFSRLKVIELWEKA